MTKIKLCGLTRTCDIEKANELKPDYIGFVFAGKSKRYVSPARARELKRGLLPSIQAVGVFTDEPLENILKLLEDGTIDVAQLHGHETGETVAELKRRTEKPVFKAFSIKPDTDPETINRCSADLVLLDSGSGGTGTVFDWTLLNKIKRPYFLAGGLNPKNIREALNALSPYGVDVSSGIETDGKKDLDKMAEFVSAVRKDTRL